MIDRGKVFVKPATEQEAFEMLKKQKVQHGDRRPGDGPPEI